MVDYIIFGIFHSSCFQTSNQRRKAKPENNRVENRLCQHPRPPGTDLLFTEFISASGGGFFAVFYRTDRTAVDASRTLVAFFTPMWFAVKHTDGFGRTVFCALPAGGTFLCDIKRFGAAGKPVETKISQGGFNPW